jgi:hypothetical protein
MKAVLLVKLISLLVEVVMLFAGDSGKAEKLHAI